MIMYVSLPVCNYFQFGRLITLLTNNIIFSLETHRNAGVKCGIVSILCWLTHPTTFKEIFIRFSECTWKISIVLWLKFNPLNFLKMSSGLIEKNWILIIKYAAY